jgi:GTP-binding protein HflX
MRSEIIIPHQICNSDSVILGEDVEYDPYEQVLVDDELFTTLSTTYRRARYCSALGLQPSYLVCDTVGFISRLPHALVDAFESTLEEVS